MLDGVAEGVDGVATGVEGGVVGVAARFLQILHIAARLTRAGVSAMDTPMSRATRFSVAVHALALVAM